LIKYVEEIYPKIDRLKNSLDHSIVLRFIEDIDDLLAYHNELLESNKLDVYRLDYLSKELMRLRNSYSCVLRESESVSIVTYIYKVYLNHFKGSKHKFQVK